LGINSLSICSRALLDGDQRAQNHCRRETQEKKEQKDFTNILVLHIEVFH